MFARFGRAFGAALRELRGQVIPGVSVGSSSCSSLFNGGYATDAGIDVTPESALRLAAVYSCVSILSRSVAQLPIFLYRRSGRTREKANDTTLYQLLHRKPNSAMSSYQFRQMVMAHLCLRGNAYAQIERDIAGRVIGLWPWHPNSVTVEQDGWDVRYTFHGKNGQSTTLPPWEVLHFRGLSLSGLIGLSPIEACRQSIGEGLAAHQMSSRYMKNGINAPVYLQLAGRLTPDAIENLRKGFKEKYAGSLNSGDIPVLEEGHELKTLGISNEDAQFLETRKYSRSEIAGIFHVPAHMIGDLEKATFSNIEQQSLEFVMHSLGPWLVNIEQQLNLSLLTEEEAKQFYFEFQVDGFLRGDVKARWESYSRGIQWGVLSPNEVRDLENRNPREGGDTYLEPANMNPSGEKTGDGNENEKNSAA